MTMRPQNGKDVESELFRAIDQYSARQESYLKDFRAGNLDKIKEWTEQVQWTFGLLRQLFTEVAVAELSDGSRIKLLNALQLVITQGEELMILASRRRRQLATLLPRMRKGKTALQGYSVFRQDREVRFLSSTG